TGDWTIAVSAQPSGTGVEVQLAPAKPPGKPKTRGFLHIVRHGGGAGAIYIVTYHRLERASSVVPENQPEGQERDALVASGIGSPPKPVLAESARALIEL